MNLPSHPFAQVDVFSDEPYRGNPVAVILDADDLTGDQMQRIAQWTNLSETTFVLSPTPEAAQQADYHVRIFTPGGEIPIAGHPTLGTAHAWLENGGTPRQHDTVVQECGAGLVHITRSTDDTLSFTAPPTIRSGPLSDEDLATVRRSLGIEHATVVDHQWVVNGPEWAAIQLPSAQHVLDLTPDLDALGDLMLGVFGFHDPADPAAADLEIRAFAPALGVPEDPVTGSLNASVGQWLVRTGKVTGAYTAAQGTVLGRQGRVLITPDGTGNVRVGGPTVTLFRGSAAS